MIDTTAIKAAAAGRWVEILQNLGGCPAEVLDGKHHPCPKCGGKNRFRVLDAAVGAVFCNQCFSENCGDGLAALGWLRDWEFRQTVAELTNYLAVNGDGDGRGPSKAKKPATIYRTARAALEALVGQYGNPSKIWRYDDAVGEMLGGVIRWDSPDGKKILPISSDGQGGWTISGMATPRPLYGLPQLAAAKVIYVVEGEKAADAAKSIGLTATTSPHGSKSAGKADWSPLAGKQVVIVPDRDADGEHYAADVTEIVTALKPPATVKIVRLPDLPVAGDIVDWIDAQGDAAEPEELRRQIEGLGDTTPLEPGKNIGSVAVATAIKAADRPIRPKASASAILPWRPFPVDALPEPIRGFVTAGAKALGCDPVMIALPLLVALASAIGATRRIRLKATWTEPAVLWGAVVAESGTSKSPAQGQALGFLRRLQTWKHQEYSGLLQQHERDSVLYEADLAQWKRTGRKAGEPPPEKPPEPIVPRYIVNDITIEALAERLKDSPRGLLVDCDELAGWLRSFDQYRKGHGADAARWLSIHRAESLTVDRKTGGVKTIFVPRAAVSIIGGIQPRTLSRHLGVEHIENGLLARLLVVDPPRVIKRWSEATVAPQLVQAVERLFGRLLALDFGLDENNNPAPIDLPLTPDGKAAWVPFYNQHAQEQVGFTGDLAAAYSKLEAYAARMAMVVHLVRWAGDDPTLGSPDAIDGWSVNVGVTLTRWFAHEAERLYGMLGESDEDRDQRRLVELIERKDGSVTPRDLMRSSSRYPVAEDAEAALGKLVKLGIGQWEPVDHAGGRGRPTMRFRLTHGTDTDTNTAKPEENTNCVSVSAVSEAENIEPIDASLAAAATDDPDEWVDL